MSAEQVAPIIVVKKIKKVSAEGHHGGAWKVAYADFVTAMMAFFLLMWLLNATTEVQRKGIADYFNPTIPINRISGGGEGAFGGDSIFSEETLAQSGTGATERVPTEQNRSRGDTGTAEQDSEYDAETSELKGLETEFTGRAGESDFANDAYRQIATRVTDEGLVIELFDVPGSPLFEPGTTEPTPLMASLIDLIAQVFKPSPHQVAVNVFTRSRPIVIAENPVWTLSSGRAEVIRQRLETGDLPEGRTQRITGYGDRKPAVGNPMSERNNRTEIIMLRKLK